MVKLAAEDKIRSPIPVYGEITCLVLLPVLFPGISLVRTRPSPKSPPGRDPRWTAAKEKVRMCVCEREQN